MEMERIWKSIEEIMSRIGSLETRQRSVDDIFRKQDIFCTRELAKWDEMKSDIGGLNERLTRLEERMKSILERLDGMATLPWKLIAAMAAIVTIFTMGVKVLIPYLKEGN